MTTEAKWTDAARKQFVGKTIASVRYMTDKEAEAQGWYRRPLMLYFSDGHWISPQMDDEGNDAGALAATGDIETYPVIDLGFKKGNMQPTIAAHNAFLQRRDREEAMAKIPKGISE